MVVATLRREQRYCGLAQHPGTAEHPLQAGKPQYRRSRGLKMAGRPILPACKADPHAALPEH